jgi:hypothetical protein
MIGVSRRDSSQRFDENPIVDFDQGAKMIGQQTIGVQLDIESLDRVDDNLVQRATVARRVR